jgi:hypothetical protein
VVEVRGIGAARVGGGDGGEEFGKDGVDGGEAGIVRGVGVLELLRAYWP